MAEGGQLPWKVQKIDESRGPPADYSCLMSPLPKPPDGVEWRRDENTREWSLVRVDDVEGENKRRYRLEVGTAWDGRAGRPAPTLVPVPKEDGAAWLAGLKTSTGASSEGRSYAEQGDTTASSGPAEEGSSSASTSSSQLPSSETEKPAVEGVDYLIHTVLPTDTLPGLCLRYRLKPTALRRINRFSGSNLRLAPTTLIIPLGPDGNGLNGGSVRAQDRTTPEFKLHAFLAEFPHLRQSEGRAYLDMADWDLDEAVRNAREDDSWERTEGKAVVRGEEEEEKELVRASGEVGVEVELRVDELALYEDDDEDEGTVGCWGQQKNGPTTASKGARGPGGASARAVLDVHVAVPAAGIELVEPASNGSSGTRTTTPGGRDRERGTTMVPAPPTVGGGEGGGDGAGLRAPLLRKIELPRIT